MTITEQQAIEWAGSATADQLTAVPAGRLTTDMGRHMLSISTSVVHCLIPGGPQPPILPLPETRPQPIIWCEEVLRRDAQKRQTFDGHAKYAHTSVLGDSGFLKTFGREETLQLRSPKLPFVRVSTLSVPCSQSRTRLKFNNPSSCVIRKFVRLPSI